MIKTTKDMKVIVDDIDNDENNVIEKKKVRLLLILELMLHKK